MLKLPEMTKSEIDSYERAIALEGVGDYVFAEYILANYIRRIQAAIAAENSRLSESTVDPEYPMYPGLSEAGAEEAQTLIEAFADKIKKAANETIGDLYTDIMPFIESDSWTNFRNKIVDGMRDYPNAKVHAIYDFKNIRRKMFEEFREEIIADIQADIVSENNELKEQIERLHAQNRARFG